jgi:glycosyltransferase involved in cell wall biosynthesis
MNHEQSFKVLICNFESLNTPSGVASYAVKLLRRLPCLTALTTRNAFQTPLEEREVNLEAKTRYNEILWMPWAGIRTIWRKIREADLIHLNPFNFTELILPAIAKVCGKRSIAVMHSNINAHFLTPKIALEMARLIIVYNIMLLTADRIVFLSRAHYENYRVFSLWKKRFHAKGVIIPNAVESQKILTERKPVESLPLTCIFVGRFERRKGVYDLLALAEQLQGEEIRFLTVGFDPGQMPKSLPNVTALGRVDNEKLFDYYDRSHVYLMPSRSEAFGITILEAMARGLVILSSDIPGMREKIEPGRNGFLFPPGDVGKMRKLLLFLKNNPREIERIGGNNLADVQAFSVEKQAESYLELYHSVLHHD